MSRIGKKPVPVPEKVKVTIEDRVLVIEGPLGKLQYEFRPEITVTYDDESKSIVVTRGSDERLARSLHGLTRALVRNMIEGVTKGYEKKLEIVTLPQLCNQAGWQTHAI